MSAFVRLWLVLAGLNGAMAVGLGAYAAHGLAEAGPEVADWMAKATHYQLIHAVALAAVAALEGAFGGRLSLRLAGFFLTAGILLFCGALYGLALAGAPVAGVAPFGGTAFILGWLFLSLGALRAGSAKVHLSKTV